MLVMRSRSRPNAVLSPAVGGSAAIRRTTTRVRALLLFIYFLRALFAVRSNSGSKIQYLRRQILRHLSAKSARRQRRAVIALRKRSINFYLFDIHSPLVLHSQCAARKRERRADKRETETARRTSERRIASRAVDSKTRCRLSSFLPPPLSSPLTMRRSQFSVELRVRCTETL